MYDEPEELTDEEIDTLTDDELGAGEPAPGSLHPRERVRLLHARREARREKDEELARLRAEVKQLRAWTEDVREAGRLGTINQAGSGRRRGGQ